MTNEFPTVEGEYRINGEWDIVLPCPLQRRFEADCLVLWCPGLTARIRFSANEAHEPKEVRLQRVRGDSPEDAFDVITETNGALLRYAYRRARADDAGASSFHGVAIGNSGYTQVVALLDSEAGLGIAQKLWRGLREPVNSPIGGCS